MTAFIKRFYDSLDDDLRYLFNERAAIYEYEGGHKRHVAERYAQRHIAELLRKEKEWAKK